MKKVIYIILCLLVPYIGSSQGLHFSQFYNAPILLNPANTGLHVGADWRAGVNYRSQWLTVPVPYNTSSVWADFGLLKNNETSWLGLGGAVWRDVAGNGDLALTKAQLNMAYHVKLDDKSTLSGGLAAAYSQRSVDLSKLTFEAQWDEFTFNTAISNQEANITQKTSFIDLSAGFNYTYYNQDDLSINVSLGAMHINRPLESFYGESNRLGIRPIVYVGAIYKAGTAVIISPSVYYTSQKKASELVFGSLFNINLNSGSANLTANEFILGTHMRLGDAVIASTGYKWKNYQFMVSYDHTISDMQRGNNSLGAFELSLILQGPYNSDDNTAAYGCPRF